VDCLSSTSRYDRFARWFRIAFLRQLLGRLQDKDKSISDEEQLFLEDIVRNVKNSVRNALSPYGDCYLDCRRSDFEIVVTDYSHSTELRLDQQSDGVRIILAMVGDIASRTSLLNPQFGSEAAKRTPGIVLIDEVDMHLHPTWQQRVLQSLRDAFPSIQFIVTTHSPQVLTTVRKEHVRVLACDEEGKWSANAPAASPLAREAGDVLASIMGTDPRPEIQAVLSDLYTYEHLVRSGMGDSEEAGQVKARLDEAGYEFSAAELALFSFLAGKAQQAGGGNRG
jgi:predicted ATP-binding protein involved in virulence